MFDMAVFQTSAAAFTSAGNAWPSIESVIAEFAWPTRIGRLIDGPVIATDPSSIHGHRKMETTMFRDFQLKIKALDAGGTFTGLASSYNGVDLIGDTITPGVFKQAIRQQGTGFPLLFAHD